VNIKKIFWTFAILLQIGPVIGGSNNQYIRGAEISLNTLQCGVDRANHEVIIRNLNDWNSREAQEAFYLLTEASGRGINVMVLAKAPYSDVAEEIIDLLENIENDQKLEENFELRFYKSDYNEKKDEVKMQVLIDGQNIQSCEGTIKKITTEEKLARKEFLADWDNKQTTQKQGLQKTISLFKEENEISRNADAMIPIKDFQSVVSGPYAGAGLSYQPGAWNATVGYKLTKLIGVEAEYIDAGSDPVGITNLKSLVNLDLIFRADLTNKLTGFGKFGVTAAKFYYDSPTDKEYPAGFVGYNIGVGVEYPVNKQTRLQLQYFIIDYLQADPFMGTYGYSSLGLNYTLGK